MDVDPLKLDSNFFKENTVVDTTRSVSYVQITKRVDKTILTVDYDARTSKRVTVGDIGKVLMAQMGISSDEVVGIIKYYFGQDKGYLKIRMAKPIDVKTRFSSIGGKAQDEFVALTIRGCEPTNEKIRLLNVNELATTNEVSMKLQSEGLSVMSISLEKCSVDVPLFANKSNGNMVAWIKKSEKSEHMKNISINGVTVPVIWCDRKKRGCFRCGKFGHNMIMCNQDQVEDSEAQIIKPQNEEVPNLLTQDKTALTLTASKESAAMLDGKNHDLNNINQGDDSEVESWKIGLEKNRTPIASHKDDTDRIEGPTSNDGTEIDLTSLAPLDDPNEFPCLDAHNQSRVLERPPRKLKRATSISPGHRAKNKKRNSRTSPQQSNEV